MVEVGLINFLFSLPLWVLAIVLNVWLMGFGLVGLWFSRRWIIPWLKLRREDSYFGSVAVQSSMLLYSLVAALTAVAVWQRYSQVSDTVSNEATAIAIFWRDLGGYPQTQRDAMQDILRGYTWQIISEAWPMQRRGEIPRQGVEWMDRLQAQLFAFEPTTESQKITHAETLRAFNQLLQQRRQRLDAISAGLPMALWWVLLPGAMACIALSLFLQVNNTRFEAILVVGMAGFLSMVLFMIIALDRPLCGSLSIPADSYQLIYDHYMKK